MLDQLCWVPLMQAGFLTDGMDLYSILQSINFKYEESVVAWSSFQSICGKQTQNSTVFYHDYLHINWKVSKEETVCKNTLEHW